MIRFSGIVTQQGAKVGSVSSHCPLLNEMNGMSSCHGKTRSDNKNNGPFHSLWPQPVACGSYVAWSSQSPSRMAQCRQRRFALAGLDTPVSRLPGCQSSLLVV